MFSLRKRPLSGGAAAAVYRNPASTLLLYLTGGYWLLLFVSSVGIIVNKFTAEVCSDLFYFLIIMACISIVSGFSVDHLRMLRIGTDTQWLLVMAFAIIYITAMGGYLYWGALNIRYHAGMGNTTTDTPNVCNEISLCMHCSPNTFWYSMVAACITGVLWTATTVTINGVLLPSLLAQMYFRAGTM